MQEKMFEVFVPVEFSIAWLAQRIQQIEVIDMLAPSKGQKVIELARYWCGVPI